MDFRRSSLPDLAEAVNAREVAARELTEHALERIDSIDGELGAFVAVDGERALDDAGALDDRIAQGGDGGPLAGIPIGVKDLEDAVGFVTTYGSVLGTDQVRAEEDSPLVARLREAGCIVVGKTNTPEYGHMAETDNPVFGPTVNPWGTERSPGGSSGGSAAAIAAGMVPLATGSDGGGSIRIPSALCGLSGIKTSQGRVPNGGPNPPGGGVFSVKGPMTRLTRDAVHALDAVIGPDPTDIFSLPLPAATWMGSIDDLHPPAAVVWSPDLGFAEVDDEVLGVCRSAVRALADLGTEVVEVDRVLGENPTLAWLTVWTVYRHRAQGHLAGTADWDRISPTLVQQLEFGRDISAADFALALDACHRFNLDLVEVFHRAPLLLCPTVAAQTPVSQQNGTINGEATQDWVKFTFPFNMTRNPAGTVCAGFTDDGMPVGLQVVGPQHADVAVLRLMATLEDALALDAVPPAYPA